jgi:hypothetical protein
MLKRWQLNENEKKRESESTLTTIPRTHFFVCAFVCVLELSLISARY